MRRFPTSLVLAFAWLACTPVSAVTVRVENENGNVTARVVTGTEVKIRQSSRARRLRPDDTLITKQPGLIVVTCQPDDGVRIDLGVDLPYGSELEVKTSSGAISVTGLILSADLVTDSGDIELAAPWSATRLQIESEQEPKEFSAPKRGKFSSRKAGGKQKQWLLSDRLPKHKVTYGKISLKARSPGRIALVDIPFPENSQVKMPWQAPAILEAILSGPRRGRPGKGAPEPKADTEPGAVDAGTPVFTADVRMVNLAVAVYDRDGRPVIDLQPEDFEVLEDGRLQKVAFAGSEEVPFNLALLLDLSGSTRRDREAMKEAARRFIEITRPHDRVAAYALASSLFQVISPLTEDRERLLTLIEAIPDVSGGTPLYDAIVLSYAEELRERPGERNAIIVLSDGIDNRIQGIGAPSKVSFEKLRRAADAMHTLIYPVFLDPFDKVPPPDWSRRARQHLQRLADVSGGRLFSAHSIRDLDPVYPQVAEELRSVYSVSYYPKNQNFDGGWRQVDVRVRRRGARVRTRAGYYAW